MNTLLNAMKEAQNYTFTENGAITHKSTMNGLMDLFAMGAAFRTRSDEDCILLFKKAFDEDPVYAMKCLFYLRDIRGGQGERRFFRVVMKWLANMHTEAARRNLKYVPLMGRWDDLYTFIDTPLESAAFDLMYGQLALDVQSATPSLLAKWLKSGNSSSKETRALGLKTREAFNMTARQYRKTLSVLRERIRVLERLMSTGRWSEIEFDKIPSRAGLIYRNAFARHDIERMREGVQTYADFAKDETTTVNTRALYPYEVVAKAFNFDNHWYSSSKIDTTERAMINKYWDNMQDVFKGYSFNGLCICDTSASMWDSDASAPINVAISIALYCAERSNGPFANHYISFSSRPQLIETDGIDFVDKVERIYRTNLCENTNIEAAFDLVLRTALSSHCRQEDLPQNLIICSDMEFDTARTTRQDIGTLMENIERKWDQAGYKMPNLVFWNIQARQNNIPMTVKDGVSYVSGMSPTIFTQIMTGKTAYDLMHETLNQPRYKDIH